MSALPPSAPPQSPILTITLNPALDLATTAPDIRPGPKLRCTAPEVDPGGGGINVSRAIRILGGESRAFIATGGPTGARLGDLLAQEGITALPFAIPGETRQSLSVTDEATGGQYRFVLPGPEWSAEMEEAALQAIGAALQPGALLALSGSQPPGVGADFPARLAAMAHEAGARLLVDTSGAALEALLERPAGVALLRLDAHEAEAHAGPRGASAAARYAEGLRARGVAEHVTVALGAEGSVLAGPGGLWHAARPAPHVLSAVGAGDSFLAAFTLALARGAAPEEALRHGTAAASSAVMTPATRLCTREETEKALKDCILARL